MNRINELKPMYVKYIPEIKEPGILYISEEYNCASHLCACGCGVNTYTPLGSGEWNITGSKEVVTLRPSIGNFMGEKPYHAHYFITNNKIQWL